MGHQRLGKPPASRNLPEIVKLLLEGNAPHRALVEAITKACDEALGRALKDPVFVDALWLLVRIPQAAKEKCFREALCAVGMSAPEPQTATELAAALDAALEAAARRNGGGLTDLGEIARRAGIAALHAVVVDRLPTLWAPTRVDVQTTIASLSGPERFGELAQRFFTGFVERTIHYFLDRAIPTHIGPAKLVRSVGDLAVFGAALRRHCDEATVIMRAFAKDWLAKNVIHEGKEITRKDIAAFGAYAAEKIRRELKVRSGSGEKV